MVCNDFSECIENRIFFLSFLSPHISPVGRGQQLPGLNVNAAQPVFANRIQATHWPTS